MTTIWTSLSTVGGITTQEALERLWEAGVRSVELAIGVKPSADTVAVLQHYQSEGMQYRAHHTIVWAEHRPFNLAHNFDVDYFERLIDWMSEMRITAYSVHAGRAAIDQHRSAVYDRFLQHLSDLNRLCSQRGIRLAVETMYPDRLNPTQQYFLQNSIEVKQLLQDLPMIDLVIDLAHLHLWQTETIAQKLQLFELAADRLLEIHVSDNDGLRDLHTSITEATWWIPYIAQFPAEVPIVLESRMNHQTAVQIQHQLDTVSTLFHTGIEQP
ncbi:hypothetical protein LEP3755_66770 (plasmid) [Leptolyngbya sp. NIES-3755]|nr:hypothetical protein LEP3755_66770 [Leptolyngbya sp. NIES-3755]